MIVIGIARASARRVPCKLAPCPLAPVPLSAVLARCAGWGLRGKGGGGWRRHPHGVAPLPPLSLSFLPSVHAHITHHLLSHRPCALTPPLLSSPLLSPLFLPPHLQRISIHTHRDRDSAVFIVARPSGNFLPRAPSICPTHEQRATSNEQRATMCGGHKHHQYPGSHTRHIQDEYPASSDSEYEGTGQGMNGSRGSNGVEVPGVANPSLLAAKADWLSPPASPGPGSNPFFDESEQKRSQMVSGGGGRGHYERAPDLLAPLFPCLVPRASLLTGPRRIGSPRRLTIRPSSHMLTFSNRTSALTSIQTQPGPEQAVRDREARASRRPFHRPRGYAEPHRSHLAWRDLLSSAGRHCCHGWPPTRRQVSHQDPLRVERRREEEEGRLREPFAQQIPEQSSDALWSPQLPVQGALQPKTPTLRPDQRQRG